MSEREESNAKAQEAITNKILEEVPKGEAQDAIIGKSSGFLEKAVKENAPIVPINISEVLKEKAQNASIGEPGGSHEKTVTKLAPNKPIKMSEKVSNKKTQEANTGKSSDPPEETVEKLVELLGKPYVKRKRRKRYPGETEEQRAKRLETAKLRLALKRQSMDEREREDYYKRRRLLSKLRQAHETPEERAERLANKRLRFHNMSEERKALTRAQIRLRRTFLRANETPEEREKRFHKQRLKSREVYLKKGQAYQERAKERERNMSETERQVLLARRRARDAARRKRQALEKQKMLENQKIVKPEPSAALCSFPSMNPSQPVKPSRPMKLFLQSEITVEPPDIPDNSFYDYVYNEIQPLMIHFNGNQQSIKNPRKN